jgi:ATP-dependent DNA ligase
MSAPYLPMLATAAAPFDAADYLFEVKWDGVRALALAGGRGWRLWGRHGVDYQARYPELAVLRRLPAGTVVDGELVVLRDGRADLPAVLRRHQARRPEIIGAAAASHPVQYVLFDLLAWRGRCCCALPLEQRRERLQTLLAELAEPRLAFSAGVVGSGCDWFARVVAAGHEGVMAKQRASRYRPGRRSPAWRKIKPVHECVCLVLGYFPMREGVPMLLLAADEEGALRYVGELRHGLGRVAARAWSRLRTAPRRPQPLVPCPRSGSWIDPGWYCRVRHQGCTQHGLLRHAVFTGWLEAPK